MSGLEIAGLLLASAIGGAMNAIAGGGTLVTFPTLLFFGTGSIAANATSTFALAVGTIGSLYGYRTHWAAVKPWLWRFAPISILGSLAGSILLTRTSEAMFSKLVPFLILFATILFLSQGVIRRAVGLADDPEGKPHPLSLRAAILFQIGVAIYGGYFGAGIGILMLASLSFMGLASIHEMNALKTVLASLINLVATAWFIHSGLVLWPKAILMTGGALAGYYLGAHFAQRIPATRVRGIITFIGLALAAATFYREFLK